MILFWFWLLRRELGLSFYAAGFLVMLLIDVNNHPNDFGQSVIVALMWPVFAILALLMHFV
jgi:hypothetical protein